MVICYSGNRKQIHRASAVNKPQSGQAANTLHFLHRQPSLSQWGLELFGLTLWVFFGLLDPWLHFLMEGSVALPFVPTGGCPVMRAGRKGLREALQGGPCWGLLGPCLETSPSKVNQRLQILLTILTLHLKTFPYFFKSLVIIYSYII